MNSRVFFGKVLMGFLILQLALPPWAMARSSGTSAATTFSHAELDQMLAPIALYPDSLIGQILVAATYPEQVVEADQWVRLNANLQGEELNSALDGKDWDLSVKALVPFPQVLSMMSDKMEWTGQMGDAFMAQQSDVLDTIQSLRDRAYTQGNLRSTQQQRVVVSGDDIEITPVDPQLIYVPAYDPNVIYGTWWDPAYPPYAYSPYYPDYIFDPYYSGAGFIGAGPFWFAACIAVGPFWGSGWGFCDWRHRHIHVNVDRTVNVNSNHIGRNQIRTASWNNAVGRGIVGRAGRVRNAGLRGMQTRPTVASVQTGLQQRRSVSSSDFSNRTTAGTTVSRGRGFGGGSAVSRSESTESFGRGGGFGGGGMGAFSRGGGFGGGSMGAASHGGGFGGGGFHGGGGGGRHR